MTGELTQINDTVAITSTFKKKEIIITESDGMKKNYMIFELLDGSISKINQFKVGDGLRVTFTIRGRKYPTKQGKIKYFNNLIVTSIEPCNLLQVNTTTSPVTSFDFLK